MASKFSLKFENSKGPSNIHQTLKCNKVFNFRNFLNFQHGIIETGLGKYYFIG